VRLELHDKPAIPGQRVHVGVLGGRGGQVVTCATSPLGESRRSPRGRRGTLRGGVAPAARAPDQGDRARSRRCAPDRGGLEGAASVGRRELEAWDLGAGSEPLREVWVQGSPTGWRQTAGSRGRGRAWAGGSSTQCLAEEIAPGSVISETKTITRGSF
jgi:hypothetical protein